MMAGLFLPLSLAAPAFHLFVWVVAGCVESGFCYVAQVSSCVPSTSASWVAVAFNFSSVDSFSFPAAHLGNCLLSDFKKIKNVKLIKALAVQTWGTGFKSPALAWNARYGCTHLQPQRYGRLLGLVSCQPSFQHNERPCLKRIRQSDRAGHLVVPLINRVSEVQTSEQVWSQLGLHVTLFVNFLKTVKSCKLGKI